MQASSQTRVISILVLMEHLETISTFPDLIQLKDVGVGGLLVGYTNSFTPAAPFKLRLERAALIGGRVPIQLTFKEAVFALKLAGFHWFCFGAYTSWLIFAHLLEKTPISQRKPMWAQSVLA